MTSHAGRVAPTGKGGVVYAIYLVEDGASELPAGIELKTIRPADGGRVRLLGSDAPLAWRAAGDGVTIEVPRQLRLDPPSRHALVFRIERSPN